MLAGGIRRDVEGLLWILFYWARGGGLQEDGLCPCLCSISDGLPFPLSFSFGNDHWLPAGLLSSTHLWNSNGLHPFWMEGRSTRVYFQRNFGFNCQEHPLDFVESQNYRVFQKKCRPYYFKHCFLSARNRGEGLTHTQDDRQASGSPIQHAARRVAIVSPLWSLGLQPARLLCSRDSPGKNTGVGCHALLQGIFLIQGSNLCLLHWQVFFFFFLTTEPLGKPSIQHRSLKWCRQVLL